MGRLREVSKAQATPDVQAIYKLRFGDRDPVADPGTATGTRGNYWTTFALVPDLLTQSYQTLSTLLSADRMLDAKLRELAILRTAIVGESRFEYSQHMKAARRLGIEQAKLDGIKGWTTCEAFSSVERAVMAAADEMVARNLIEDTTFEALKRHLSDIEIFELVFLVGSFRMHGMIVRALQLECDDDVTARMRELPDPVAASK